MDLTVLFMLCSCGGNGGGGTGLIPTPDTTAPDIHFDALGMQGSLDEPAVVSVNGIADQDATVDTSFSVIITLGDNGLPLDPDIGTTASGSLIMTATGPSMNLGGQELDFTIYN